MYKPEVRIIDQQQEEIKPVDISQYEKEMLLAKYGFKSQPSYTEPQPVDPNAGLTFEEMCRREEQRLADERARKYQQMYGPKPITFGGNNYHSNETYGSDSDSGLNFKITVVSDMPIPKNY
jgi:hypothetical protein